MSATMSAPTVHHMPQQQQQQRQKLTLAQGRYVCQRTLGCGTYGRVLQCMDQRTNSVVAVKVSQKESAYTRAALVEYNTIVRLQEHTPHTVRVFDQFEERGHICIAMEMLSQNLFELGRKRVESNGDLLHVDELRQIVYCVFSALAELHRLGLMHCDIKPENVMVRSGRAPSHAGLNATTSTSVSASSFMHHLTSQSLRGANPCCADTSSSCSSFTSSPAAGDAAMRRSSISGITNSPSSAVVTTPTTPAGGCSLAEACTPLSPAHTGLPQHQQQQGLGSTTNSSGVDWNNTCLIDYGAVRRLHENNYFDIQSMWYRAPEVLCHVPYTPKIDSWSMGCLLYEMYTGRPLFMGNDPTEQLQLITEVVGCFPHIRERYPKLALNRPEYRHEIMTEVLRRKVEATREKHLAKKNGGSASPRQQQQPRLDETLFVDLMAQLLCPNELQRISCEQALQHPFFTTGPLSPCVTPNPNLLSAATARGVSSGSYSALQPQPQSAHYVARSTKAGAGLPSFSFSNGGLSASPSSVSTSSASASGQVFRQATGSGVMQTNSSSSLMCNSSMNMINNLPQGVVMGVPLMMSSGAVQGTATTPTQQPLSAKSMSISSLSTSTSTSTSSNSTQPNPSAASGSGFTTTNTVNNTTASTSSSNGGYYYSPNGARPILVPFSQGGGMNSQQQDQLQPHQVYTPTYYSATTCSMGQLPPPPQQNLMAPGSVRSTSRFATGTSKTQTL
eukprot:gene10965-7610_t